MTVLALRYVLWLHCVPSRRPSNLRHPETKMNIVVGSLYLFTHANYICSLHVFYSEFYYPMCFPAVICGFILGALTGKYTPENPPTGPRGRIYTPEFLTKARTLYYVPLFLTTIFSPFLYYVPLFLLQYLAHFCWMEVHYMQLQPLITRIKEIGENYGKTPTQVWLFCPKLLKLFACFVSISIVFN